MPNGLDRRDFLGRVAAALGGAAVGGSLVNAEGLAGMASSGRRAYDALGVQLYTVRSLMQESVADTLAAVAEIGYTEVELAGLFNHEPAEFRSMLDDLGLSAPSTHMGLGEFEGGLLEPALERASLLGNRWVVVPWLSREMMTPGGIESVASSLNRIGEAGRAHGIRAAFHNHSIEWEGMEGGRSPMEVLLSETDPEIVSLQMDVYWTVDAGQDPLHWLRRDPGRYVSLHVKDRTADGEMVAVGDGVIDWGTILPEAERLGVEHVFVEHDNPANPNGDVASSYAHLREVLG